MELFEAIRREYEFGVGTIQGVARKLGVHRRMVREALGSAVPAERLAANRARWSTSNFVGRHVNALSRCAQFYRGLQTL